jgi:predicted nucleotidyltransferase
MPGLLDALGRGLTRYGIDFFLVGALARDVSMAINNLSPKRATTDADFAILIPDTKTYGELKEYLVGVEGFNTYSGNSFVLLWVDGTEVDLFPFGDIEDQGKVHVDGTGYTTMHVDGFREVYEQGLPEIELESGQKFKYCSLPGIVLLKLIAWDDRPEARRDDILDISDILNHYFDINSNEIYNEHSALFDENDARLIDIAATVLGREMGTILKRNTALANRVTAILNQNTAIAVDSRMGAIMTEYFDNTVEDNIALLKRVKKGLLEKIV